MFVGIGIGLVWIPCSSPILASVLVLASAKETAVRGAFMLFVYLPGYADADVFTKVLAYVYQELDEDFQSYLKREDNFRGEQKLINVSENEDVFDPYVVYVTADELVAQRLVELGAFRVLLF